MNCDVGSVDAGPVSTWANEDVAAGSRENRARPEDSTQIADAVAQRGEGLRRRGRAPDIVDQPLSGEWRAVGNKEAEQHSSADRPSKRLRSTVNADVERAKNGQPKPLLHCPRSRVKPRRDGPGHSIQDAVKSGFLLPLRRKTGGKKPDKLHHRVVTRLSRRQITRT